MDELRAVADRLHFEPPTLEELVRRNRRRHARRRAGAAVVAAVAIVAASVVALAHRPSKESQVITTPPAANGVLAVGSDRGVVFVDEHRGQVATVDLGTQPHRLAW